MIIEPHYLGSIEYFVALKKHREVCFEVNDTFRKQTYRNRAYFLTSNKIQSLSIPLSYSNGMITKDVKIDYRQRWVKDHWGAFYSGYGKAPFFEFFNQEFKSVWEKKYSYLIDLNMTFLELVKKILQLDFDVKLTDEYQVSYPNDHRDVINPKKPFSDRKIYVPQTYPQLFGDTFVPNLSIVDLIMCEGPNSAQILTNSDLEID